MRRKYRIKEKNGKFYPQYKIFLFYEYFTILGSVFYQGTTYEEGWRNTNEYIRWYSENIQDAKEFIDEDKRKRTKYHYV